MSQPRSGAHNAERAILVCRVTAFSPTSLFLERFWRKLRISFRSHKQVVKTKTPNNGIFDLLMTFAFPLSLLIVIMR